MKRITTLMATLTLLLVAAQMTFAQKNTLTPEEDASGYQLLFNGTNMTGWRGWNGTTIPNSWAVQAESTWNVIINTSGSAGSVPLVTTDTTYQNFDFKTEFLVPSAGNAGIFIRYNQYGKNNWGGASGPETQIAAINNSDGTNNLHRMGTCYDMFGLQSSALNWDKTGPSGVNYGVYHQLRIVAFNNHVVHYGNGIKLVEYDMTSSAYNTAYNASKYSTYPIYKTIHQGGMYLQHHGETGIRFRTMRIKRLTESPWAQNSVYLKNPLDSTGGLKDSLSFSDNLFPTALLQGREAGSTVKTRMLRDNQGLSLVFEQTGDYVVRVSELNGKQVFKGSVRNDNRAAIPASAFAGATHVVSVHAASGALTFRQVLAPAN